MITICTPTYNRAYILDRPYKSLKAQSSKNFKWLIIDDGSNDNTEEVVRNFQKHCNEFEIEYHKKANGGRHTALNYSYQFIKTEYVLNLDSDDALMDDAVEKLEKLIEIVKKQENYEKIWQISCRSLDSENGDLVGEKYPDDINSFDEKKRRKIFANVSGEKHNCRKVSILKEYPFPIYDGIKFVTENTVWDLINREYDSYCTNVPISLYYQNMSDSLTSGNMHSITNHKSAYNYYVFVLNNLVDQIHYNKNVIKSFPNIPKHAMLAGVPVKQVLRDLDAMLSKAMVLFCYPVAWSYLKIKKKK